MRLELRVLFRDFTTVAKTFFVAPIGFFPRSNAEQPTEETPEDLPRRPVRIP